MTDVMKLGQCGAYNNCYVPQVRIPMVGKYTGLSDAYLSVLKGVDGVLVPRGFGDGGVQGKILATKYAGEHSVPFLGICLGMQIVVNE
ncbi:uncharacterized protein LOC128193977 isoform X2 [Vigna angularis]|uniref:uncharacterized protein LOC128193977 isoform X2 n=1 Tax=Phaseolus angularis TaxID=3914 RepID=UPI0022B2C5EF|nr:uncharacterized protein LOC128193977 isoform X2 [Vigna angularis]